MTKLASTSIKTYNLVQKKPGRPVRSLRIILLGTAVLLCRLCQPIYAATQVSQYGITWTFDKDYTVGQFVNGDNWVLGPVTIVSISPAPSGERNGSMVNPFSDRAQAYDSRISFYDSALLKTAPFSLSPGESLVSTISSHPSEIPTTDIVGGYIGSETTACLRTAAVLTCLSSAPSELSFRPPYFGPNKGLHPASNVRWDLLPSLPATQNTPDIQTFARYFQRVWIDHMYNWMSRRMHPIENMPNYGREYVSTVGDAGSLLCLDFTLEEKHDLAIGMIQVGIDLYAVAQNFKNVWVPSGGHNPGRKFPILFAGLMLNDNGMLTLNDYDTQEGTATYFGSDVEPSQTLWTGWQDSGHQYAANVLYRYSKTATPGYEFEGVHPNYWFDSPWPVNTNWAHVQMDGYRRQTTYAWMSQAIAARILGLKPYWNHDAYFAYCDRWAYEDDGPNGQAIWDAYNNHAEPGVPPPDPAILTIHGKSYFSVFAKEMYETYRPLQDQQQSPIIADHTAVEEYDEIPQNYINEVKNMLLNYPGESHGRGLFYGLELLEQQDGKFAVNSTWFGTPESTTDQHLRIFRAHWTGSTWDNYGGEEDMYTSQAAINIMNNHLGHCKNTLNNNIDAFAFGWCWDMTWHNAPGGGIDPVYQVRWAGSSVGGPEGDLRWGLDDGDTTLTGNSVNMQDYLDALESYQQNNPDTTIVYSTGPAEGGGESGYQRYLKNERIREWVRNSQDRYLFDYADILNYNDAGEDYIVSWDGHTFPQRHPDNIGNYDGGDGGCHISQGGCLRLAKAMWVLLAKKAGWNGSGTDTYTLNISINGSGSVTKTPDKSSYNLDEEVTLQANPDASHSFINWSGDLSGSSNPATIVMNTDKSVTANFTTDTYYTITATAGSGGQISPSGATQVTTGSSQAYTISANAEYHIADVLVDGSSVGAVSSYTFTNVTANHTITASFAVNIYTITASVGNGGQISPSGATQVSSGSSQVYTITASGGYHIADVLVDGSSVGPVSSYTFTNVTANHTISATFAFNTYTITASAGSGGQISPSGTTQVSAGNSQAYTITANAGYHISDVLVDGGSVGAVSSYTFTYVTANHTISATFAVNTYTITASAGSGGQISPSGATQVSSGSSQTYTITAVAGYHIANVLVDGGSIGAVSSYTFTNVTGNHTISASFDIDEIDETAPAVVNLSPQADDIQAPLNTLITLHITDPGDGVDADSVTIQVNNNLVYSGDTAKYSSAYGECHRIGTEADYTFIYQSNDMFDFDQLISVTVNASDLAGNVMDQYSYSFRTEMRSFGRNILVDSDDLTKGGPVTACDSRGDIWVAWHAGATGNQDIYVNKLTTDSGAFGNSIKLTNSTADQRNPAIAIGSDDKLYVAWQDSRNGNWDIYISTSTDGVNWSAETRVTDSNDNEIKPAIDTDTSIPNNVYIAWEDSRNGNQDIYIGASNNGFATTTVTQITSELSYQIEPVIAVDSDNTVYVVWTDARNSGNNDIYGAASNSGPWTNIPIVTENESQSSPAIATEAAGSILHLVWVDDGAGENNIYYAKTGGGLPVSPLSGSNIIDDTTNADQKRPAIVVNGSTDSYLRIYACWEDDRNGDDDLYILEINSSSGTNVFVGDDGTNTDQTEPAIGIDANGHPYLVWINDKIDIYYAGSTFVEPDVLASGNISPSSTVTVGTALNAIDSVEDVSVEVPQGAYPCDIKITISKVQNSQEFDFDRFGGPYEFGPSGIDFIIPVTITIPYEVTGSETISYTAYWYNPLTNSLSQQGITDIETVVISSTLHALRFKTSHFSQFLIGGNFGGSSSSSSGGGGGGCSMSPDSQASAAELLLPYLGLIVAMIVLKLRDRRKRKACNIT